MDLVVCWQPGESGYPPAMGVHTKKQSPSGRTVKARLTAIEHRLGLNGDGPPDVALGDLLRAYPGGGIPKLARDVVRNSDTIYDFEKGRNRRVKFPADTARLIAAAYRKRRCRPLGVAVTQEWLREAWFRVVVKK